MVYFVWSTTAAEDECMMLNIVYSLAMCATSSPRQLIMKEHDMGGLSTPQTVVIFSAGSNPSERITSSLY